MKSKGRKARIFLAVTLIALAVIGVKALGDYQDRQYWNSQIVKVFPMANQHITWEGAGYNGIWERSGGK